MKGVLWLLESPPREALSGNEFPQLDAYPMMLLLLVERIKPNNKSIERGRERSERATIHADNPNRLRDRSRSR